MVTEFQLYSIDIQLGDTMAFVCFVCKHVYSPHLQA